MSGMKAKADELKARLEKEGVKAIVILMEGQQLNYVFTKMGTGEAIDLLVHTQKALILKLQEGVKQ